MVRSEKAIKKLVEAQAATIQVWSRPQVQPIVQPSFRALVPIAENTMYRIEKDAFYQDAVSITVESGATKTVYRMDLRSGTIFYSHDDGQAFSIRVHEPGPEHVEWDLLASRMGDLLDEAAARAVSEEAAAGIRRLKTYLK
jgi:hypothetical protein